MNKDYIISIQELLKGRNDEFDKADKTRVRLIRHKDNRGVKLIEGKEYDTTLYDLFLNDNDVFMSYQHEQEKKRFENVDYIVSFIGEEGLLSRFIGVYKNNGPIRAAGYYKEKELAIFDFQEVSGFDLLKERVIIEWHVPISWLQGYGNEMPVIRIDRGLKENNIPIFTRFEDVMLDYNQLKLIFDTKDSEWKSRLESCNCIYLILDKKTGKQYIGSTYNSEGIWGRWKQYANTGHGGDKDLIKLLNEDSQYAKKYFQWCILETLPLKILDMHAIARETLYKRKFGTLSHGYNAN